MILNVSVPTYVLESDYAYDQLEIFSEDYEHV